jgi:predicted flap endonuclease-1-like 5' DNA nuclease
MNNQTTKTNTNKYIVIAIAILSIISLASAFVPTSNILRAKADDTSKVTPAAAPSTVTPAETPVTKATSASPAFTSIKSTDVAITGAATASANIELKDGNGNAISCKNSPIVTNASGVFSCELYTPLSTNTIVSATATESGKNVSSPVNASVSEGVVAPVASTPAPTTNGGLLQFNIPESLKNSTTANQYTANLSVPSLGDWKINPGVAIPGLAGMVPYLAQKDNSNYLSTFLSNQTPEIANKSTTRVTLDQAALDAASGVAGFRPVEVGGISNLVRIPNLSTLATDDWWYVPKANVETQGYMATANDVSVYGTPNASTAFYQGNINSQTMPKTNDSMPYSFILEGTPSSFGPSNSFALNGKASTPENLNYIDNLVRGSTFDNASMKFGLPKINLPSGVNIPKVGASTSGWDLWWLLPLLLLLALLAFLWWLLKRLFGWGAKEDVSSYSKTYTGVNNNFKKSTTSTYNNDYNIKKTSEVVTPKYVAPVEEEITYVQPAPKYVAPEPKYEAPKSKVQSPAAAAAVVAAATYVAKEVEKETVKPMAAVARHSMRKDDLKVVEGIGPVIEGNLHDAGILTYQDLANTTEAEIEKILAPITNNFTVFNCSTWAEQAQLAADGKFDELQKLKDILDKGVRR